MNTTSKTNSVEIAKYSYESISAKLSGYVEVNKKVRLINSFAYQDPNRDRANLLFLKQFGVVPQDLSSRHGEMEINELTSLDSYDGLTIFIESIFVPDSISNNISTSGNQAEKIETNVRKLDFRKDNTAGTCDFLAEEYMNRINRQTKILANWIETKSKYFKGGYIYITGFSCLSTNHGDNENTELEFLPWYFESGNMTGAQKILTQPELDVFLKTLTEKPPLIANLDDLLAGIDSNKLHV